jgi:hypothetical protein
MAPRCIITMDDAGGCEYAFRFVGENADPLVRVRVEGGQINGEDDTSNTRYGLWFENVADVQVDGTRLSGLDTTNDNGGIQKWTQTTALSVGDERWWNGRRYVVTSAGTTSSSNPPTGTGTGITDGTVTWDFLEYVRAQIRIDYCLNTTLRDIVGSACEHVVYVDKSTTGQVPTSFRLENGRQRSAKRAVYLEDITGSINIEGVIENSGVGLELFTREASGIGCKSVRIASYFEGNGKDVLTSAPGFATSKHEGLLLENNFFNSVSATDSNSNAFWTADAGDYAVDLDSVQHVTFGQNTWTTNGSVSDLRFGSSVDDVLILEQQNEPTVTKAGGTSSVIAYRPANGYELASDGDTTPNVFGVSTLDFTNYSSSTTVTDFDRGHVGQVVALYFNNGNVTLSNNANINTGTGSNLTPSAGDVYVMTYATGKWRING